MGCDLSCSPLSLVDDSKFYKHAFFTEGLENSSDACSWGQIRGTPDFERKQNVTDFGETGCDLLAS